MKFSHHIRRGVLLLALLFLFTAVGCAAQEPVSSPDTPNTTTNPPYTTAAGSTSPQTDPPADTTTAAETTVATTTADKPDGSSSGPVTSTTPPATTTKPVPADDVAAILARMTLEEKVGQVFMPRCPASGAEAAIQTYSPAGYVLFARDFEGKTADQVRQTLNSYQQASKIPLLLSTDEEGGTVVRVSLNSLLRPAGKFLSPQDVYRSGGFHAVIQDTREKARLLLSLGVNVNLAPVCDISTDPNDYIYPRSFGQSAENTASYIATVVATMQEEGISGTLKHFPGYGNNIDTHGDIAYDDRPYSQFAEQDFLPFIAGIEQGVPGILVSHNIVACMDPDYPASLSKEVHRILRETLGFDGVIMTDDLSMGAIKKYTGGRSPAVAAIHAGNDLLLTSDWETDYAALLEAVRAGEVPLSRIDDAVERVLNWKIDKGLLPAD